MSAFLDAVTRGLNRAIAFAGATAFSIEGVEYSGDWTDISEMTKIVAGGQEVSVNVTVLCTRAQFAVLPRAGQRVTRLSDGKQFRILADVRSDEVSVGFDLDTPHK